mmetsp:Transcript_17003/g.47744  ORF Transcript_17003/g.47744 Transcript_17003/m.47744 type:complete len:436 (+) Transcript_17003:1792-3099(+)
MSSAKSIWTMSLVLRIPLRWLGESVRRSCCRRRLSVRRRLAVHGRLPKWWLLLLLLWSRWLRKRWCRAVAGVTLVAGAGQRVSVRWHTAVSRCCWGEAGWRQCGATVCGRCSEWRCRVPSWRGRVWVVRRHRIWRAEWRGSLLLRDWRHRRCLLRRQGVVAVCSCSGWRRLRRRVLLERRVERQAGHEVWLAARWNRWRGWIVKGNQAGLILVADRGRLRLGGLAVGLLALAELLQALELCGGDGLPLLCGDVRIVLGIAAVVMSIPAPVPSPAATAMNGTDHHARRPELEDLRKREETHAVDPQVEWPGTDDVLRRRSGDEMALERAVETWHSQSKLVLEHLVGSPTVLAGLAEVDVLAIGENLPLSRIERPDEDDLVLAAAASCSRLPFLHRLVVCDAEFERNALLGESKRLGHVLGAVVHLIRNEGRHGCLC